MKYATIILDLVICELR